MNNQQIKTAARALRAYNVKRKGILANLTATPQTAEQLGGNLEDKRLHSALKRFVRAGLVRRCDSAPTEKGYGKLNTYAATPMLEKCRAFEKTGLPTFSAGQIVLLVEAYNLGVFSVPEIAKTAGLSKSAAQLYVTAMFGNGYFSRTSQGFTVGQPYYKYRAERPVLEFLNAFYEAFA